LLGLGEMGPSSTSAEYFSEGGVSSATESAKTLFITPIKTYLTAFLAKGVLGLFENGSVGELGIFSLNILTFNNFSVLAKEKCFGSAIALIPVMRRERVAPRARIGPAVYWDVTIALALYALSLELVA